MLPLEEVRRLRARLILEGALGTIEGLGFKTRLSDNVDRHQIEGVADFWFKATHKENLEEIADGCADLSVVTIGTLVACGIHDHQLFEDDRRKEDLLLVLVFLLLILVLLLLPEHGY
jgi:hypothetical protein